MKKSFDSKFKYLNLSIVSEDQESDDEYHCYMNHGLNIIVNNMTLPNPEAVRLLPNLYSKFRADVHHEFS